MPISIDWGTRVISVPQSYLTPLGGSVYELNLDEFRLDLKGLEDDVDGMPFPDTHRHFTQVSLAGITLGRVIEIINGFTVTFDDGQYAVNAVGANSNIADVMNLNQVSLRTFNSAGLQVVTAGSGVTEQDKLDIADRVWDEDKVTHTVFDSFGNEVQLLLSSSEIPSIVTGVWNADKSGYMVGGSFGEEVQSHATPEEVETQVTVSLAAYDAPTKAEMDILETSLSTLIIDVLGITGQNVKWSGFEHDDNNNLTHAVITQYTDSTLATIRKNWQLDATYDTENQLTSYQMKIV